MATRSLCFSLCPSALRRATWQPSTLWSPLHRCSSANSALYAFAQLGGALAGLLFIRVAPRSGISLGWSEGWYALRNRYYRWKRRRAARKFEVYMRSQDRSIHVDGYGRPIDDDPDDKKRWN